MLQSHYKYSTYAVKMYTRGKDLMLNVEPGAVE